MNYNRFLVYWLRHQRDRHPTKSSFQLLEHIAQAGDSRYTHAYPLNSPAIFTILIACMRKNRYGITVGIQDRCATIFRTSVLISCTHGESRHCEDEVDHPGIAWAPSSSEPQLAVHGTTLENWGLIVRDGALKSMDRTDIHFTTFRSGMMIKEMPQLLKKGIFLFIDPSVLHHRDGFTVVQNLNDVVKVETGENGMNINFLMTAIDGTGKYADLDQPYIRVPRVPNSLEPLLQEFIQQLNNPATALFNDCYGTMGPRARKKMEQAKVLAEGYQKMADSLNLTDASEHTLQIMDRQSSASSSDFRAYNTNPRTGALAARQPDAEPLLNDMISFFKAIEDIPEDHREPTSVRTQLSLREEPTQRDRTF